MKQLNLHRGAPAAAAEAASCVPLFEGGVQGKVGHPEDGSGEDRLEPSPPFTSLRAPQRPLQSLEA